MKKGFDDACGKMQADCQMIFTQTEGSIEQQAANMQAALAGKPDVLMTSIVDNNAFTSIAAGGAQGRASPSSASTSTPLQGPAKEARQAFVGQDLYAAGVALGNAQIANFPKDGPSASGRRRQRAGAELVGAARRRHHQGRLTISRPPTPAATDQDRCGSIPAPISAITADRVGAYLNANKDMNAYFDTGFWHAAVARVLRDRGVAPGKVLLGGFDLVPEVLQEMKAGYVQVQVDQQPYMQGFIPVMEVYLLQDRRPAPTDVNTGKALIYPDQAKAIIDLVKKGLR